MSTLDYPTTAPIALQSLRSPDATFDVALYARVAQLYAAAAQAVSDGRLTEWTELFVDKAKYSMISRANYDRGLPLATMFYESRGALVDRVTAIDNTMVYAPRYVSLIVSNVGVVDRIDGRARTRSSFAMYHTLVDGDAQLFMIGRTFDEIDVADDALRFARRVVVFDSERVPGSVIYPI